jgi:hypothetical protein
MDRNFKKSYEKYIKNMLRMSTFYFQFPIFREENVVQKRFQKLCYSKLDKEQICDSVTYYHV